MPSPVGHALGGLIVGLASAPRPPADGAPPAREAMPVRHLVLCALVACLPDADFLWGRHNMETHSLGFALLVGMAATVAARQSGWAPHTASALRIGLACAIAVATHVLFDWLGSDDSPPLGVMALWPFSDRFYFADAFVFEAISRRYWLAGFVVHNVLAIVREVAVLAPVAGLVWWARLRSG